MGGNTLKTRYGEELGLLEKRCGRVKKSEDCGKRPRSPGIERRVSSHRSNGIREKRAGHFLRPKEGHEDHPTLETYIKESEGAKTQGDCLKKEETRSSTTNLQRKSFRYSFSQLGFAENESFGEGTSNNDEREEG